MAITTQYITGVCAQSASFDVRMECICESNATAWTTTVEYRFQIYIKQSEATDFKFDGGEGFYFYNADTYEQIGNRWYFSVYTQTYQPGAWHTISRTTRTYSHNTDGTLPPICVGGTMSDKKTNTGFGFHKNQGSITFDTLFRKATITSAPNFKDNENPTVKYSNLMGNSVDSLQMCIADSTGYTIFVPYRDVSKTGTSYTFNLTTKERQTLIDAVKTGVSVGIRFYIKMEINGGAHRHSVSKTFSLSDIMPDLAPVVVDMNDATIALTGDINTLIRYESKAACNTNGTVKQDATIKNQKVVNGSTTKENTTGVFAIDNVESAIFTFSITDSRNNTTTATVNKKDTNQFIDYVKPGCAVVAQLEMNPDKQTVKANIYIKGMYYKGSFGAVDNDFSLYLRYKGNNDEYTEWLPIISEFVEDVNGSLDLNGASLTDQLPYRETYTFQARITDKLNTFESIEYTTKLVPVFDWSKTDFNFNVPVSLSDGFTAENECMVKGNFYLGETDDDYVAYGMRSSGTEKVSGKNLVWRYQKWSDGRAECYGVWNLGNMGVSTAYGNWYESASSFNIDFPAYFFVDAPEVLHMDVMSASGSAFVERGFGSEPSATNTGDFKICRPLSGNLSQVKVSFHAIGRWK